ncbi:MAG TPA: hypothetical protein VEB18_01905 [Candidatus Paceibacterota bacterium]|nr:hypothetical protein [Candidatus Paceibacterota bacterium]
MTSRVLPVILILAALGIFFGYVNPTYSGEVKTLQSEIRSYDAALRAASEFREKEAQLTLERNGISNEGLRRVEAFLPDGVDNVQLILDLNSLASRSGMVLSDFDIVDRAEQEDSEGTALTLESDDATDSIDLTVNATGSYENFKKFLKGAEWSLRPLDLVSLEIKDSATGIYTYTMTFRLYWLR